MTTIISGTNRENSYTYKLALIYQRLLTELNIESTVFSLTDIPDHVLSTDLYGKRSKAFMPIQELVNKTQKFLWVLPEYNGSFPGIAKIFVDCCDFPESFKDKKAGLVGLSSGKYGNIRGIDHFTGICHYVGLYLLPLKLHIPTIKDEISAEGNLTNALTKKFVREQVEKFIHF